MALLEALALSFIAVILVQDRADIHVSRNERAPLTSSTAITMAVRRRCYGNDGAITFRPSHTRLRCSSVIVVHLGFIGSDRVAGI